MSLEAPEVMWSGPKISSSAARVDEQVVAVVKEAHQKALQLLQENEGKLRELAEYLLEKETITGEEFMAILNRA